ncbi:MAG: hypothetical protein QOH80_1795, partial [Actinomycetota bacterium]|nr:hypothetical protein [Actinomycetota bacterium]
VCLVFDVVAVFRGSEAGLHIDLRGAARATGAAHWIGGIDGPLTASFAAVVTLAMVLARGAGVVGLVGTRDGRRDPLTWLLLGAGLAGAAAVVVFDHPGSSQGYFALSAGPLLALASALGFAAMADRLGSPFWWASGIGAVAGPVMALLPTFLLGDLDPAGGMSHAVGLLLVAAAVLVAAGIGSLLVTRHPAMLPATLAATVCAGGITVVVVAQLESVRGGSHRASLALVAALIITIVTMGALLVWRRSPRLAAAVTATVSALGLLALATGSLDHPLVPPSRVVTPATPFALSNDHIRAARWIRDHSGVDDMVMSNRHCSTPSAPHHCDSRRFIAAALTERQVLLEGWTATPRSAELGPHGRDSITVDYWKPELLALNDGFIASPSWSAWQSLRNLGVTWVYVDNTRPHAPSLEPYARRVFHSHWADVYALADTHS